MNIIYIVGLVGSFRRGVIIQIAEVIQNAPSDVKAKDMVTQSDSPKLDIQDLCEAASRDHA